MPAMRTDRQQIDLLIDRVPVQRCLGNPCFRDAPDRVRCPWQGRRHEPGAVVQSTPMDHVVRLARLTQDSGCDGVVASPQEVRAIRAACGPDFVIVTPGIRGGSAVAAPDDQHRTATPAGAIQAGSSYIVVGRPITGAHDPKAAASAIAEELKSGSRL